MGWAGAPLPEHVPDEYDRAKKLKKAEMERHRQLVQELSFRSMSSRSRGHEFGATALHMDEQF